MIYGQRFAALVILQSDSERRLIYRYGWINDNGELNEASQLVTVLPEIKQSPVELGYIVDFDGLVTFNWRIAREELKSIEPPFSAGAGKWIGARMGLFGRGTAESSDGLIICKSFIVENL